MKLLKSAFLFFVVACIGFAAVAHAGFSVSTSAKKDVVADQGRNLAEKYQGSLVHIQGTLSATMNVPGQPVRKEDVPFVVQGTILNDSGLIVCSYNSMNTVYLNPIQAVRDQTGAPVNITRTGQITEVRIRYFDGEEVQARIVLKDPDMDLAFILPVKKVKPQVYLDTSVKGTVALFDQVIGLSNGPGSKYRPYLVINRINGVFDEPYTQYLASVSPGTPIFSVDGKVVGIGFLRTDRAGIAAGQFPPARPIIIPIDDLMGVASQIEYK